jgi:hypothetical protein
LGVLFGDEAAIFVEGLYEEGFKEIYTFTIVASVGFHLIHCSYLVDFDL